MLFFKKQFDIDRADFNLIDSFTKAICYNDPSLVLTGINESLRSHKLVLQLKDQELIKF